MIGRIVQYGILSIATLFFLLPVYLVIVTALKEPAAISLEDTWKPPERWYWESFTQAWTAFLPKLQNSFILTISATLLSALLMYLTTFRANQIAKGAAIAMILLLLVAAVIVPYLYRQLKSEVRR